MWRGIGAQIAGTLGGRRGVFARGVAGALLVSTAFALASSALAQVPASEQSQPVSPPSPEEQLWTEIGELAAARPTSQPYSAWFAESAQTRRTLIDTLVLYQTLYPGGRHRHSAVRQELQARFELAALQGGDYTTLRNRITSILSDNTAPTVCRSEAAYWDLNCRRTIRQSAQRVTPGGRPTSQPAAALDPALRAAYRDYIKRFPKSEYVPQLARELAVQADAAGKPDELRPIVALLKQNFPEHATTQALAATLHRTEQLGRPFWLATEQSDGPPIDTREWLGDMVLIVVWSSQTEASRLTVRAAEEFRAAHEKVRVVGICVDLNLPVGDGGLEPERVPWPLVHDGLGFAGDFVRAWGIDQAPAVLVIDGDGNLAGCRFDASWKDVANHALKP